MATRIKTPWQAEDGSHHATKVEAGRRDATLRIGELIVQALDLDFDTAEPLVTALAHDEVIADLRRLATVKPRAKRAPKKEAA